MEKSRNETLLFERQSGGELAVLNCFPNTYEIGMASLGYQTIFKLFASNSKTHSTRYFTDWHEPHSKEVDLLSFSISWELDFFNLLKIFEQLQIPACSKERDTEPFVFGGGPVLTANPEPWADFFDIIAIGDAEGNIDQIIEASIEARKQIAAGTSRKKALSLFKTIPGIYVPSLDENPDKVERQASKSNQLAVSSVIAPEACWSDTGLIEVVRSCPEMCKFCLASFGSLPFRAPKLDDELIPKVEMLLAHTKNIGLLGASVTQHPKFMELLYWLKENHSDVKLQLASVRASTVTKEMTDLLAEFGVRNLTIAIESGSEKLREEINKKLPTEYIFSAAKAAQESGLSSLKLYGMVGLPTETEEDIDATIQLLKDLKKENKTLKIIWGCSIFTPKFLTPYAKFGVDKNSEKKLKRLEKELRKDGIEVRPESYKWAQVQALISRGDRNMSDLLLRVKQSGQTGFNVYKKLLDKKDYEHFVFADW